MPACCVKNCKSRSDFPRSVKLFRFPKDKAVRQLWIKACKKNESDVKIDSTRICSLHFKDNCFENRWTKPRGKAVSKQIRRLKKNSVPSELLTLEKKRKASKSYGVIDTHIFVNRTEVLNEVDVNEESIEVLRDMLEKETREKKKLFEEKNMLFVEKNILLKEKHELVESNKLLNKQVKELLMDVQRKSQALHKVFTSKQIQLLMSQKSEIKWSVEDITSAIALRSISPKAYQYLRNVKKMPFPCFTTLRNWCSTFNVLPGILKDVLEIMGAKGQNFCIKERLTILTFDELYILNKIDVQRKKQKICETRKTYQFVMARGLFHKWIQPIYYEFDTPMSADTLLTIIQNLYQIGYIVVAVTCDMRLTNMKLWNELNIGTDISTDIHKKNISEINKQNFITHPADSSLQIFFYADVPHLLKLVRNNFLKSGFKIKGSYVDKTCLEELLKLNKIDLKVPHNLTTAHLDLRGTQRLNIKTSTYIFSNTNALAIQWCGENGLLTSPQWKQTANVLKLFNDWFNILNNKCKHGHSNESDAYGTNLHEHNKIIEDMNNFIREIRVGQRSTLLPFQKGILLCNKSLVEMFSYIQKKYSSEVFPIKYLLTNRLNLDVLDKLFSHLRMKGEGYDHPTPEELRKRLKLYILGEHSGYTISSSTETSGDSSLITVDIEDTCCTECMADKEKPMNTEEVLNEIENDAMEKVIQEAEILFLGPVIPSFDQSQLTRQITTYRINPTA